MTDQADGLAVTVERIEAAGRFVLVCEHASNFFPPRWGDLGLDAEARAAGRGAFQIEGKMIDPPVVRRAEEILALAG